MPTIRETLSPFAPEQDYKERKHLTVSERGQVYKLELSPARESAVYAVDGDIIREGQKCDKLVIFNVDDAWHEIFVELKGCDVAHAIEQLESTLKHPLFKSVASPERRARIVANRIPRNTGNSVLERAKVSFKKKYHCDLRACNSGAKETISN